MALDSSRHPGHYLLKTVLAILFVQWLVCPVLVARADGLQSYPAGIATGDKTTTFDAGGNSIKILYKGTLTGDQMKMTREREGSGQPREFTIKRSGT